MYASLAQGGLAAGTVRHIHTIVHKALKEAKVWGLIRNNPAESVKPPTAPEYERRILQPDQARALLDRLRVSDQRLYPLASLGLATGLRRNEMLALRWKDVDLAASKLTVERTLEQTVAYGIRVKAPKTKRGKRTIALPAHIVAELQAHWRAQQEARLAAGLGRIPADSLVLAGPDGKPQSPGAISKAWKGAMTAIGMPNITLHSLRHSHASVLIAGGTDILTVSRRLGHANPSITLSVYGHLIHGTDDKAAEIMEAAFGSARL
jgi:integrase